MKGGKKGKSEKALNPIDENRSRAYLQAYVRRVELQKELEKKRSYASTPSIPSLSPIRNNPEKLYEHSQGAVIASRKKSPPRIMVHSIKFLLPINYFRFHLAILIFVT